MAYLFQNRFFGATTMPDRTRTIFGFRPLLTAGGGAVEACCPQSTSPGNPNYVVPCCAAAAWEDKAPFNIYGRVLGPSSLTSPPL